MQLWLAWAKYSSEALQPRIQVSLGYKCCSLLLDYVRPSCCHCFFFFFFLHSPWAWVFLDPLLCHTILFTHNFALSKLWAIKLEIPHWAYIFSVVCYSGLCGPVQITPVQQHVIITNCIPAYWTWIKLGVTLQKVKWANFSSFFSMLDESSLVNFCLLSQVVYLNLSGLEKTSEKPVEDLAWLC